MKRHFLVGCLLLLTTLSAPFAFGKSKYGPSTKLSSAHEYLQKSAAPDYWALAPYYTAQQDEKSCSIASVTMLLNAARAKQELTSDEELVTQKSLMKKNSAWDHAVGLLGKGATLDELKILVEESMKAYGIKFLSVEAFHVVDESEKSRNQLKKVLIENEKSDRDFILLNFIQGKFTGDSDVGHIAPLGAYDLATKRALIMDPDRTWYEPYWVPLETLLAGLATLDTGAKKNRGYVWVKLAP